MSLLSWGKWSQCEKQGFLTSDELVPSGSVDAMVNETSENASVRRSKPWWSVRAHSGFGSVSEVRGV